MLNFDFLIFNEWERMEGGGRREGRGSPVKLPGIGRVLRVLPLFSHLIRAILRSHYCENVNYFVEGHITFAGNLSLVRYGVLIKRTDSAHERVALNR